MCGALPPFLHAYSLNNLDLKNLNLNFVTGLPVGLNNSDIFKVT